MTKKGSEEPMGSDTKQAEVWWSHFTSHLFSWPFWPYSFFSRGQRTDVGASQEETIAPPETAQPPTTPEPEPRAVSEAPSTQGEKGQVVRWLAPYYQTFIVLMQVAAQEKKTICETEQKKYLPYRRTTRDSAISAQEAKGRRRRGLEPCATVSYS